MIVLPSVTDPSSLLWTETLSRKAYALKDECGHIAKAKRHRPIESLADDAEGLKEQGDPAGCAVVLIHLADVCRAKGKLGPALKCAQQAEQIFSTWPFSRYNQNHAVALYSLGLVHQLLGSEDEAWKCYDRALEGFRMAEACWSEMKVAEDWKCRCREVMSRVEQLMTYISHARALGGSSALQMSTLIGCCPVDSKLIDADGWVIEAMIERIRADLRLRFGNQDYRLTELDSDISPELTVGLEDEYSVLKVPTEVVDMFPQFKGASYALINQHIPEATRLASLVLGQELGASVEKGNEVLWGRFVRDPTNRIQFEVAYPADSMKPPRIIGIDDLQKGDERKAGSVVGVFRPV